MEKSEFDGQIVEISFDKKYNTDGVLAYTNLPDTTKEDNGVFIWCVPKDKFTKSKMVELITKKGLTVRFLGDCKLSPMDNGVTDTNITFYVDDIQVYPTM